MTRTEALARWPEQIRIIESELDGLEPDELLTVLGIDLGAADLTGRINDALERLLLSADPAVRADIETIFRNGLRIARGAFEREGRVCAYVQ